jgi:hypothetical protein
MVGAFEPRHIDITARKIKHLGQAGLGDCERSLRVGHRDTLVDHPHPMLVDRNINAMSAMRGVPSAGTSFGSRGIAHVTAPFAKNQRFRRR